MKDRDQIITENPLLEYVHGRGFESVKKGNEQAILCPFHADKSPSLRINSEKNTWYCDPCDIGGSVIDFVMRLDGISSGAAMSKLAGEQQNYQPVKIKEPMEQEQQQPAVRPKPVKSYSYTDELGNEIYQAVRFEPKTFAQRHKVDGKWIWKMDGVKRVLYHLQDVMDSDTVWIVEGEKDADNLVAIGLVATCNVGGAGKWLDAYTATLEGKKVYLCGDNDKAGKEHVDKVLESIAGKVKSVHIVKVPEPHKDVSDYLETVAESERLKAISSLANRAHVLYKGIDLPVQGAEESSYGYMEYLRMIETHAFDIGRWLPSLGQHIINLVPGELVTVLADTGVGKTAILQNIAMSAAPMDVLFFEMELPSPLTHQRFLQIGNRMTAQEIKLAYKSGNVPDHGPMKHVHVCGESGLTSERLKELIIKSELKIGCKPKVVFLDYIGLMRGRGERYERISNIAEELRIISKNLNVVFICASQIHRRPSASTNEIGLHDAKDSGSVENSSSTVLGAWRDDDDLSILKIKILKNTSGTGGGEVYDCKFDFPIMTIREIMPKFESSKPPVPYADPELPDLEQTEAPF